MPLSPVKCSFEAKNKNIFLDFSFDDDFYNCQATFAYNKRHYCGCYNDMACYMVENFKRALHFLTPEKLILIDKILLDLKKILAGYV